MKVDRLADAQAFLDTAGPYLAAREALHNLTLGVVARYAANPGTYGDVTPYFAVVVQDGRIAGCASRTAAVGAILSEVESPDAADALARDLHDALPDLAGVVGPAEATARFAEVWGDLAGTTPYVGVRQLIYECDAVSSPVVPGAARIYESRDRSLVLDWLAAFEAEALPHEQPGGIVEFLDRRLADPASTLLLWEDDGATVSLAMAGATTPNGIRIGPVYTPPEQRRRGYAGAVTAELTRRELAAGRRYCFLYTDESNATSNSVYRKIGYRVVGDSTQWRLR
jgi:ribosomal protein S18 acetylase RimI-like enzyme